MLYFLFYGMFCPLFHDMSYFLKKRWKRSEKEGKPIWLNTLSHIYTYTNSYSSSFFNLNIETIFWAESLALIFGQNQKKDQDHGNLLKFGLIRQVWLIGNLFINTWQAFASFSNISNMWYHSFVACFRSYMWGIWELFGYFLKIACATCICGPLFYVWYFYMDMFLMMSKPGAQNLMENQFV